MKDALAIHHAHMESIQILCSRDYTTEEIKAWGHLNLLRRNNMKFWPPALKKESKSEAYKFGKSRISVRRSSTPRHQIYNNSKSR